MSVSYLTHPIFSINLLNFLHLLKVNKEGVVIDSISLLTQFFYTSAYVNNIIWTSNFTTFLT